MSAVPRLLVVDDDPTILSVVTECLREEGYCVRGAMSVAAGLAALASDPCDLVLADAFHDNYRRDALPWAALDRLREASAPAPVIIFSAHHAALFAGWAERGYAGHITKPFDMEALIATVRDCLRRAAP